MKSDPETAVFVAGGTGFIGSRLLAALGENGYRVLCLARDSARAALCREKGAEVVIGNIDEYGYLKATVEELAASTGLATGYTDDVTISTTYFDTTATSQLLFAVSEPSTFGILTVACAAMLVRRRRRFRA